MAGIDMARLTAASSVKSSSVKKGSASSASAKETSKSDFASMMQGKADGAASGETQTGSRSEMRTRKIRFLLKRKRIRLKRCRSSRQRWAR